MDSPGIGNLAIPNVSNTISRQGSTKKPLFPVKPISVDRSDCTWYVQNYCEENAYRLSKVFRELSKNTPFEVAFVSNKAKKVPLWSQKVATSLIVPVIWDYHVLVLLTTKSPSGQVTNYVYDQDSTLKFPETMGEYVKSALRPKKVTEMPEVYHRKYRVIDGDRFLRYFASDRSHMKTEEGTWTSDPPSNNPITTPGISKSR